LNRGVQPCSWNAEIKNWRLRLHQRGIDGMLERLAPGDRLIVSELSRLGRSLGQVIHIVDELVKRKIRFTAIKESIHFEGK
jgi:DNA invertase Pin-like site-specific DNA recombinase